jgi:hypothetical protein
VRFSLFCFVSQVLGGLVIGGAFGVIASGRMCKSELLKIPYEQTSQYRDETRLIRQEQQQQTKEETK